MNIPIETLIGWAGTLIAIASSFGVAHYRINQNAENNKENAENIKDVWRWKNSHEKDVTETREKFQNQISELKGASLVVNEQFRQIMAMFEEIKARLSYLENNKN